MLSLTSIGMTHVFSCHRLFEASDGAFIVSSSAYEPEAIEAIRRWFGERNQKVVLYGPLLPSASKTTAAAHEKKQSAQGNEIQEFLDTTLQTSGEKSLLYVSLFLTPYFAEYTDTFMTAVDLFRIRFLAH